MTYIYIKIFLAFILSVLPFVYANSIRKNKAEHGHNGNLLLWLSKIFPKLKKIMLKIKNAMHGFFQRLPKSDACRNFYTLVVLLVLITVQAIDFNASESAKKIIQKNSNETTVKATAYTTDFITKNHHEKSKQKHTVNSNINSAENSSQNYLKNAVKKHLNFDVENICISTVVNSFFPGTENTYRSTTEKIFSPFVTTMSAYFLAAVFTLLFFSYKTADKILQKIHNIKIFFFFFLIILITLTEQKYFVLSESFYIILIAAYFYPEKNFSSTPKGGKNLFEEKKNQARKAA